jgi:hypothetical protein
MPTRKTIFENGCFYHILNRSIQSIPIFQDPRECNIFINSFEFYNQTNPPHRFSLHREANPKIPINPSDELVDILNFCLISNHFHLTLMQKKDRGITTFMQNITNSFSHFYNIKFKNVGPLF